MMDKRVMAGAAMTLVLFTSVTRRAMADAMVVTQAMKASTIAEIFIEEDEVRVQIEIGAQDIAAFANLLPDDLYQKVTGETQPLEQRLQTFFESDWQIQADGELLAGQLEEIVPAKRVVRDEVTGDALAEQPDDADIVIRVALHYPLKGRPQSISIRPPRKGKIPVANIGFVCYHKRLPVNDFRYLPGEATVDLDWNDPWYSRFRHANLRRQFDAPLSAYLYVEPYEVRKEIIIRPQDLQTWIDLGLRDDAVIPIGKQVGLQKRIALFLSAKNPVLIDGKRAEGRLDRIHFIHRTLRTTGIIEPPEDLDPTSATLGIIFVYPVDRLPDEVSMKWELFNEKIQSVPAVASDEAGRLPSAVTPDDPVLVWKNYLINPTIPQLVNIAPPPTQQRFAIPIVSLGCGIVSLLILVVVGRHWSSGRGFSRPMLAAAGVLVVVGVMARPLAIVRVGNPLAVRPDLSEDSAKTVLSGLLHNVYRSFDHHDDNLIYDRLAKSIAGELLSDVYLETRESMEVKNQGGLRISVKEVDVTQIDPLDEDGPVHSFRCHWRVAGSIGHWGHIHKRANEHEALITISPRDGSWKITNIEMIDQQTVQGAPAVNAKQQAAGT